MALMTRRMIGADDYDVGDDYDYQEEKKEENSKFGRR